MLGNFPLSGYVQQCLLFLWARSKTVKIPLSAHRRLSVLPNVCLSLCKSGMAVSLLGSLVFTYGPIILARSEVGIYKRKQEPDQERKIVFSFFLDRFLARVLVFLFS